MTEKPSPLITVVGDDDAEMCGPDGCAIPANHPILNSLSTPTEEKDATQS